MRVCSSTCRIWPNPEPMESGFIALSCSSCCRIRFRVLTGRLSSLAPYSKRAAERASRSVLEEAGGRPVVFRTLDVGGDKILPYLRQPKEENPAMGWRAIRMSLDRPELFRLQMRAMLKAAAGSELKIMIPMVSAAYELGAIRALIDREKAFLAKHGYPLPNNVLVGAMFEVPALLFELDAFLTRVDFVSVGSNDLMQFLVPSDPRK